MAMTATLTLSPSSVYINQSVEATLTMSNGGSSTVNIVAVNPSVKITGGLAGAGQAAATGVVQLGPGSVVAVAASGSLVKTFGVVFFAPSTGPIGAGTNTWDVSAQCYGSDGSVFAPSAAHALVNPLPLPTTEQ